MKELPSGWRKNPTKTGNDLLFKLFKTGDLATTFDYINRISPVILKSDKQKQIGLTLSNDFLSISLNDLGQEESLEEFIELAKEIDSQLQF